MSVRKNDQGAKGIQEWWGDRHMEKAFPRSWSWGRHLNAMCWEPWEQPGEECHRKRDPLMQSAEAGAFLACLRQQQGSEWEKLKPEKWVGIWEGREAGQITKLDGLYMVFRVPIILDWFSIAKFSICLKVRLVTDWKLVNSRPSQDGFEFQAWTQWIMKILSLPLLLFRVAFWVSTGLKGITL
jgi:hypothetical protein